MQPDYAATACFFLAVLHTFGVHKFLDLSHRFKRGSAGENLFQLLGEVEVVFGIWAGVYLVSLALQKGVETQIHYVESLSFIEPAFVFVVMVVCATRPIMELATVLLEWVARMIPLPRGVAFYIVALTVGPWLGSFITEPAAMTVVALVLLERYFGTNTSIKFKYATVGLLFVNVSIGGTLTPFAAPPVLMVAGSWNWDLSFMLQNFAWKAIAACLISTLAVATLFFKELKALPEFPRAKIRMPMWISVSHLIMLAAIVLCAHYAIMFMGLFFFFLGLANVTQEYHEDLKLREGLLVAFFLAGVVVLGPPQRWWLTPVLSSLDNLALYLGAMGLTAVTDNAAITFLGSQVPTLAESSRYVLVAGAVVGGGLTVIANAPNPAGYGILNRTFGEDGISPVWLLISALGPTAVAACCFWWM